MDNSTVFYIVGAVLAASAIVVSFIGLRVESFPGRFAPLVFLWFAILVGGATTFAVLNGKDEQEARAAEVASAGEEFTEEEKSPVDSGEAEDAGKAKPEAKAKGPGGTLKLAADQTQIAFDTTTLTSKPGKVTIDFDNPSALEHDVAIEQNGKQIAISETIAKGKTSVSADLAPGTYTFLCTIPGHAEAGMEGTLTIK
ncbi:MAG TPA: plastocyanin/azurin family copper-binding protein [Solirubrobacterales bacterium]